MKINKESNGYTFGFAIVLVVIVGSILAILAMGLKPIQDKNDEIKKQLDILSAMLNVDSLGIDRSNVELEFAKYFNDTTSLVLNASSKIVNDIDPFSIDIKKEYKDKTLEEKCHPFCAVD